MTKRGPDAVADKWDDDDDDNDTVCLPTHSCPSLIVIYQAHSNPHQEPQAPAYFCPYLECPPSNFHSLIGTKDQVNVYDDRLILRPLDFKFPV